MLLLKDAGLFYFLIVFLVLFYILIIIVQFFLLYTPVYTHSSLLPEVLFPVFFFGVALRTLILLTYLYCGKFFIVLQLWKFSWVQQSMLASVVFSNLKCIASGSFRLSYSSLSNQLLFILCVGCFVYFYICVPCMGLVPVDAEEVSRSPGTRVTQSCEPVCGCQALDPGPPEGLFTTDPSPPLSCYVYWLSCVCDLWFSLTALSPFSLFCFYYNMPLEVCCMFLLICYQVCFLYLPGCVLLNLGKISSMTQLKIWSVVLTWDSSPLSRPML